MRPISDKDRKWLANICKENGITFDDIQFVNKTKTGELNLYTLSSVYPCHIYGFGYITPQPVSMYELLNGTASLLSNNDREWIMKEIEDHKFIYESAKNNLFIIKQVYQNYQWDINKNIVMLCTFENTSNIVDTQDDNDNAIFKRLLPNRSYNVAELLGDADDN